MGQIARNWGANVIEWGNSHTFANVYAVKLIEACWVCDKSKDQQAEYLPILCSKCFHECRIKGVSEATEEIVLLNYLYNNSYLDSLP